MKNKGWNLYNISKSRGILMGIATLSVALFHSYYYHFENITSNEALIDFLYFLRKTGNIGVDIFLFLSGIGLYFSFSKNSNVKDFWKKRLLRILPAVLIVAVTYSIYKRVSLNVFFNKVFLIEFFINGERDFWYFSLAIILYILYPLLHKIIDKKGINGLIVLIFISIETTLLLVNINFALYKRIEIALTRIPIFLIGIYMGKKVKNKEEIPEYTMLIFLALFIIISLLKLKYPFKLYIVVRYLYCIYGISIVFLVSYIHSKINFKNINKFLIFIGTYSMEVYLIYENLAIEIRKLGLLNINNNFIFYTMMFIITIIMSIGLKKLCNLIVELFDDETDNDEQKLIEDRTKLLLEAPKFQREK